VNIEVIALRPLALSSLWVAQAQNYVCDFNSPQTSEAQSRLTPTGPFPSQIILTQHGENGNQTPPPRIQSHRAPQIRKVTALRKTIFRGLRNEARAKTAKGAKYRE
jgi:hypothetical protein